MTRNHKYGGVTAAEVREIYAAPRSLSWYWTHGCSQVTRVRTTLEKEVLPKLRSLESILQPINRLPKDILILVPRFFTNEVGEHEMFPMNKPLIMMTHVCRSWRNLLLSTPSLWTQIDFSTYKSKQAEGFLGRSRKQFLDIHHFFGSRGDTTEPFLSTTLQNLYRVRRLDIGSTSQRLERVLVQFTAPAPELQHLEIMNDIDFTNRDVKLPSNIFEGQLPKLTSLTLYFLRTDLRGFNFPSITRFSFTTGTYISIGNLTSFFERCPLLEFIQIRLSYAPQPPIAPPRKRVRLGALKELRFDLTASTSGLLDHLTLPKCTEMLLKGQFTGKEFDGKGYPVARIHPSSIDHLPVTRGITKAVAMPHSCILSGPNGNLRFWCFFENRNDFDAEFFTSFAPISVSGIKELWIGSTIESYPGRIPWKQTATGVRGAFEVLTKVEDLTIVSCETEPILTTLDVKIDNAVFLPGLRRLTIYVGCGELDISALIQSTKARKEHSRPLEELAIIFENEPGADAVRELETLGEIVGGFDYRIGMAPVMRQWQIREEERW